MSEETKVVFSLTNRQWMEDKSDFFKEVKAELDELISNAWYSRMESRAMRMLVHQLGGSVQLKLMTEADTPKTLSIWTNGLITTADEGYHRRVYHRRVSTKLLALAPDMFDMLKGLQECIEGGTQISADQVEQLRDLINRAKS